MTKGTGPSIQRQELPPTLSGPHQQQQCHNSIMTQPPLGRTAKHQQQPRSIIPTPIHATSHATHQHHSTIHDQPMSAYPDTRERRAGEARSHSDRDQRLRQMRGWSEMESDDGEMSGRSGSSGGLRTETHLCLSHSALQSLSGPHPTRTASYHCRSVVCSGARSRPTSRSYPTSVNCPFGTNWQVTV